MATEWRCEGCGLRTINLFGGLCITCDEGQALKKLPEGKPPDNTSSP